MGLAKDLRIALWKAGDLLDPFKRQTAFGHALRSFPAPGPRALPDPLPKVAILTPCKDALGYLETYFELIDRLEYPKDRLHLRILEGDSRDDTHAVARRKIAAREAAYASADVIKQDLRFKAGEGRRSRPEIQRQRRSAIATSRNRLLQAALETDAAYFLFLDVDLVAVDPETLRAMLRFDAPILMANCLLEGTRAVFDLNAFRYTRPITDRMANRFVKGGIYQPPKGYFRHYPGPDSVSELEPLHSVGGTCLLIRRDVAEAGVDFPEDPFHLHIETEGFALKASEAGFGAFSATRILVYHGWET